MKDSLGDEMSVIHTPLFGEVWLRVFEGPDFCTAMMTPKKARKLARRLQIAADEVETSDAERAADGLV